MAKDKSEMKTSAKGLALIKHFESFQAKPYWCPVGVPTIGYGSTRYADGTRVTMQDEPITEPQAEQLLAATLAQYENAVTRAVNVPLTQHQFDALVSLCYNIGPTNFASSTLVKYLNKKQDAAAAAQFLVWNKGGGVVLGGLVRRRKAEKHLFEVGELQLEK